MDWMAQFDGYCERTDLTYWSEPINALTNAAFIIVAILMWGRVGRLLGARVLCVVLFAIGVGSYLFHTHATGWAALTDVAPIAAYILIYLFLVNRHIMGWPIWMAALGTAGFIPYAIGVTVVLRDVAFFEVSNFYWTVPILLLIYAPIVGGATARGLVIGAAILSVSISLRSVDETLCEALPFGTHFAWHILNAVMLGWMIEVYRRHMVERDAARG